jgi:hypothetical protein
MWSEVSVAGSALLMLLVAQWILFRAIPGASYIANDGKMAQSVVLTAFEFAGYFNVTNLSPIQGIGSQLLPKNVWANPSLWPFAFFDRATATDISALIALACFAGAVYVMMRCFDLPVLPSAVAAQSCIVLFGPAMIMLQMPSNFCLTPADAVVYAPYMVALGLLARLQAGSWRSFALTTIGISALIFYSVYCDPLWTMVAAIALVVPFVVVTLAPLHLNTIVTRGAAIGFCLALLVLSGVAAYLYTLSQYTARVHFADTLDRVRGPGLVSAMTYASNMRLFYLACALGWILGLVTLRGRGRVLVLAAATSFVFWAGYSVLYLLLLNAKWVLPIPLYLEQCLFALYLAGAVAGYWGMLRATALLVIRVAGSLVRRAGTTFERPVPAEWAVQKSLGDDGTGLSPRIRLVAMVLAILCAAIVPAKVADKVLVLAVRMPNFQDPWPNEPELIEFFAENIGLVAGQPFRGAVNVPAADFVTSSTIAALWSRNVPTLNEYSQLVTPEALYFVHALLKRDVRQHLNRFDMFWSEGVYTPAFWNALQMLGVRYSAAPWPLPDHLHPALPLITKPHRPNLPDRPPGTWHVYELPRPNVGNYSPTEVATAGSGPEIMAALSEPDFDFARRVVLPAPIAEPLAPARDMRLSVIRGGLHVSARSDRTSLVVLPQQFSHCLRARDPNVRLMRANLMLTAMVFSGDIDTDIVFDYGIFSPRCRRADLAELKQLDLKIDLRMSHLSDDRLLPDWDGAVARLRAAARAIK